MRLSIEKIIYPGKSLGRHVGKVVLTDEGLPGETVETSIVSEKKNFIQAQTQEVLTASADRIAPRCAHYRICGPYQYIQPAAHVAIKHAQVQEFFTHGLRLTNIDIISRPSPEMWQYRNKLQVHLLHHDGQCVPAYHVPGTHDQFAPIERCALAAAPLNALVTQAAALLTAKQESSVLQLTARHSRSQDKLLLGLQGENAAASANVHAIAAELARQFPISGIIYQSARTSRGTVLAGTNQLEEVVNGKCFGFGIDSFFQINIPLLEQLARDLQATLGNNPGSLLDLYAGVGTFGILLAAVCRSVTAVEVSPEDMAFLQNNIQANHLSHINLRPGSAEHWAQSLLKQAPDIALVDPPRRGLDERICGALNKYPPQRLVYISCDPATLLRDLKLLSEKFLIRQVFWYDFFPQTPHIETMAILERQATA
ncbi:MAG: 23S rRNA (uracil(1939)-C(5))-methyltransferase RlmD [Candidatus Omnitrophica bacterium]|nr:23S rRNA (uracil(1939)-C(5))-methyltransferase RlmD [Candidatus Omnitrophota bacterium]